MLSLLRLKPKCWRWGWVTLPESKRLLQGRNGSPHGTVFWKWMLESALHRVWSGKSAWKASVLVRGSFRKLLWLLPLHSAVLDSWGSNVSLSPAQQIWLDHKGMSSCSGSLPINRLSRKSDFKHRKYMWSLKVSQWPSPDKTNLLHILQPGYS